MKFDSKLMNDIKRDLNCNRVPMLLGEPGIGKSSWVESLAAEMHTKCFTLACNQLADKADLTGARMVPTGNDDDYKQVFFPHQDIMDAVEYATANPRETPILFLDELNRTNADVTSACLSLVTARRIGKVHLPSNLKLMIAGNDKGNVTSLDSASVTRFSQYRVTPDTQTFLNIHTDLNPFIKSVLTAYPDLIFCKKLTLAVTKKKDDDDDDNQSDELSIEDLLEDADDMVQITTPRTIASLSDFLNQFTQQEMIEYLTDMHVEDGEEISRLQEVIEAHVGKTNFSVSLMAEIAKNIANASNQTQSSLTVGKPAIYDSLKACQDMTSMNNLINSMSNNERSGCMVYAVYEKEDNRNIITALAGTITSLEPDDVKMMVRLAAADQLDRENMNVLASTQTPLSANLAILMDM